MEQQRPNSPENRDSNPMHELPTDQKFRAGDRVFLKKDPTREWNIVAMNNEQVMIMNESPDIGHSYITMKFLIDNFEVKPGQSLHDQGKKPDSAESSSIRKKN